MKNVFVCSRTAVSKTTSKHGITHVLSLLDHGVKPFLHPKTDKKNWLLLHFEDNTTLEQPNGPTKGHVIQILEWAKKLPDDAIILSHCEAGVSRSTAAAIAILVQKHGIDKIDECIEWVVSVRPQACPNPLITNWADEILGCNGELHTKCEAVANAKLIKFLANKKW